MKRVTYMILCVLFLFAHNISAQETKKVQEPEYIGVFAFLDPGTSNLQDLERQTPEAKVKVKAFGYGGAESSMQIKGDRSPIRFKTNQKLEFIVRTASQQIDPMSLIQLFSFTPNKGMRRLMMAKVGSIGMSSKAVTNQSAISFNVAKYGDSSFKVVPANTLSPGEYCLSTSTSTDAFCFGIDSSEQKQ